MKNKLCLVLLFCCCIVRSTAQLHPKSSEYINSITSSAAIETVMLPAVNGDSLKQADIELGYENRAGIRQIVSINPELHGTVDNLPDGGRLWRMRFVSPGATSHSFLFSSFHLAQGAEMWVYAEDNNFAIKGPITSKNNKHYQRFTIGSTAGSIHILELYEPPSVLNQSILLLSSAYQGYRGSLPSLPPPPNNPKNKDIQRAFGGSTSNTATCNPNVNCPYGDDWCREKYAVCHIETYGEHGSVCTGTLVNNTANDKKAYILSAWHCLKNFREHPDCDLSTEELTQVEDWVFVFNWWSNRSADCANSGTQAQATANVNGKEYHGADIRALYRQTDMLLLEIVSEGNETLGSPTEEFYYAGWSRSTTTPTQGTTLHHPSGDIMKIAQCSDSINIAAFGNGSDCSTDSTYDGNRPSSSNFWKFVWNLGHTEGGSSGSAVFDENHKIRGTLSNHDELYCNIVKPQKANFGKFDISWTGGGTSASRLSDWLDPLSLNPTTWQGFSSNTVSIYNRYTDSDGRHLDISGATYVARYYAITNLTLGGGKHWTSTVPTGASQDVAFEFDPNNGGDVSAGKRIALKQCLTISERYSVNERVRIYISEPPCASGVQSHDNISPINLIHKSDPTPSSGTCNRLFSAISGYAPEKHSNTPMDKTILLTNEIIRVVPNPTDGMVTIYYSVALAGTARVEIVNLYGQSISTIADGEQRQGNHTVNFNTQELPNGVYFVQFRSPIGVISKPIMVSH